MARPTVFAHFPRKEDVFFDRYPEAAGQLTRAIRDVTYQEDKPLVSTGNAPRVMATLPSLAISLLRLDGQTSIAAANRAPRPRPSADAQAASDRMSDFAGSLVL